MTLSPLAIAVTHAVLGLFVAVLYVTTAALLGRLLVGTRFGALRAVEPIAFFAVGAAAFSLVYSTLAVAGLTPPWLVVTIGIGVLVLAGLLLWGDIRRAIGAIGAVPASLFRNYARDIWFVAILALLALYVICAAAFALTSFRGADLAIYHLVIPRDTLGNGGLVYNPFFYGAGIPLGWHMFGLPAYALGGPAGYLALSTLCLVLTLALAWCVGCDVLPDYPAAGPVSALVIAFVCVGHSQGSISNNDIAALFLELLALAIAVRESERPGQAFFLGVICGFLVATKITLIMGAALIFAIYVLRHKASWLRIAFAFALGFLPLGLFWPSYNFWHTGTPIPGLLASTRWSKPVLPQVTQTAALTAELYGRWYEINFSRLFTGSMIGLLVLFALLPAALALAAREVRKVGSFIVLFALLQFGLMFLAVRRLDVLYNDRYNAVIYVLCALSATWCLFAVAGRFAGFRKSGGRLASALIVVIAAIGLVQDGKTKDMEPDGTISETVVPSLLRQAWLQFKAMRGGPEPPTDKLTSYIQRHVPKDAIVATTNVAPYPLQRRFFQMLPMAQTEIDLTQPPEVIETELRQHGACYLHVPSSSNFNPWMNLEIERWLKSLRQVCHLPDAQMLEIDDAVKDKPEGVVCKFSSC